jgi:hypothetical protein
LYLIKEKSKNWRCEGNRNNRLENCNSIHFIHNVNTKESINCCRNLNTWGCLKIYPSSRTWLRSDQLQEERDTVRRYHLVSVPSHYSILSFEPGAKSNLRYLQPWWFHSQRV